MQAHQHYHEPQPEALKPMACAVTKLQRLHQALHYTITFQLEIKVIKLMHKVSKWIYIPNPDQYTFTQEIHIPILRVVYIQQQSKNKSKERQIIIKKCNANNKSPLHFKMTNHVNSISNLNAFVYISIYSIYVSQQQFYNNFEQMACNPHIHIHTHINNLIAPKC